MLIGIVGGGKMGQMFKRILQEKHRVFIYSERTMQDFTSLQELYENAEMIIMALPHEPLKKRIVDIARISTVLREEKTIFDISTFKREIISLYTRFPGYVKVASVHPMFGAGAKSFSGKTFILVPVPGREKDARDIFSFLSDLGGHVKILDAQVHDRIMGMVIGVPYFLGLSYLNFATEMELAQFGGTSYRFMKTYALAVLNDTTEFIDEVLKSSQNEIEEFLRYLKNGKVNPRYLRNIFSQEIKDAYEQFYRVLGD